ncbi:MAG: ABC transporter ATP-binding protein, partial [Lachnospiraceae bacterium]|nr:ABC transporter ATP-binding protein [Lachnospiraceae bacterium]
MKERIAFYAKRIKEGRLKEMWRQTVWIYGYGKKHWLAMIIYTLMGLVGTVVSLGVSFASRDLVNIITGFQAGKLIQTFSIMIGLGIANSILSQITSYVSALVGMRVDAEIKADIFEKILVTDWESLTNYHTGDLL